MAKVEGFKPCCEGKVRRGFTLPLKVDGNGGLEARYKGWACSHLQDKVEGGGIRDYKRFILAF